MSVSVIWLIYSELIINHIFQAPSGVDFERTLLHLHRSQKCRYLDQEHKGQCASCLISNKAWVYAKCATYGEVEPSRWCNIALNERQTNIREIFFAGFPIAGDLSSLPAAARAKLTYLQFFHSRLRGATRPHKTTRTVRYRSYYCVTSCHDMLIEPSLSYNFQRNRN